MTNGAVGAAPDGAPGGMERGASGRGTRRAPIRGAFNPDAPILLREECEVEGPPEVAWRVLLDVGAWPRWHRGIDFAVLRGGAVPGASLTWRADGMRIASLLVEVDEPNYVGWTIRTFGARGYQRWTLAAAPGGRTRVRLEESWEGLAVRILRGTLRRTLRLSREEWMAGLARAVRRADPVEEPS